MSVIFSLIFYDYYNHVSNVSSCFYLVSFFQSEIQLFKISLFSFKFLWDRGVDIHLAIITSRITSDPHTKALRVETYSFFLSKLNLN